MIAVETNEGFPSEIKEGKNGSNQPRFAISFASPVDVKRYNYALIYCIVVLSMHEFLGIQREDFSPSIPPISLSPSLFLCFSFIYLNVNYICVGCRHCGVVMYSVLVFLVSVCVCEWELISKCSFRCFFLCSKIKEVMVLLPFMLYLFLSLGFSLQLFIFGLKCSPCVD